MASVGKEKINVRKSSRAIKKKQKSGQASRPGDDQCQAEEEVKQGADKGQRSDDG